MAFFITFQFTVISTGKENVAPADNETVMAPVIVENEPVELSQSLCTGDVQSDVEIPLSAGQCSGEIQNEGSSDHPGTAEVVPVENSVEEWEQEVFDPWVNKNSYCLNSIIPYDVLHKIK